MHFCQRATVDSTTATHTELTAAVRRQLKVRDYYLIFVTFHDGDMIVYLWETGAWVFREMQKCEWVLCEMLCETAPSCKEMECNGVALSSYLSIYLCCVCRTRDHSQTAWHLTIKVPRHGDLPGSPDGHGGGANLGGVRIRIRVRLTIRANCISVKMEKPHCCWTGW